MSNQKLREIAGKIRSIANDLDDIAEGEENTRAQEALRIMERSCQSKRSYDSPEAAGQAAKDREVEGLRVYKCYFCGGYHLTKLKTEVFQQNAERTKG